MVSLYLEEKVVCDEHSYSESVTEMFTSQCQCSLPISQHNPEGTDWL